MTIPILPKKGFTTSPTNDSVFDRESSVSNVYLELSASRYAHIHGQLRLCPPSAAWPDRFPMMPLLLGIGGTFSAPTTPALAPVLTVERAASFGDWCGPWKHRDSCSSAHTTSPTSQKVREFFFKPD